MKRLYIARHAKSSWKDASLADFDRPLNKRGKRDAPLMGKILKQHGVLPELIIASPAKRARKTATIIAAELGYPKKNIILAQKIYDNGLQEILQIIANSNDTIKSLMVVGHNPDLTIMAEILSGTMISNIPTSGVFCLDFNNSSWKDISPASGTKVFFEYPKRHIQLP